MCDKDIQTLIVRIFVLYVINFSVLECTLLNVHVPLDMMMDFIDCIKY